MESGTFRETAAQLRGWVANFGRRPELADMASQSIKTLLHPGLVGPAYRAEGLG